MNTPVQSNQQLLDTLIKHYGVEQVVSKINCNAIDAQHKAEMEPFLKHKSINHLCDDFFVK